jgi:hypothetical protein
MGSRIHDKMKAKSDGGQERPSQSVNSTPSMQIDVGKLFIGIGVAQSFHALSLKRRKSQT